jgi:hypothetical protein
MTQSSRSFSPWAFLLLLSAPACGGEARQAKDASSVHQEPSTSVEDDLASLDESAPKAKPSADEAGGNDEPAEVAQRSGPATDEDVQRILQLVLNDEALAPLLDLGAPGRFPLKVARRDVPGSVELTQGEKPVTFVDGPESKEDPVLFFTDINIEGDQAYVKFRYDVEKLNGSATLERKDYGWELVQSRHTQR